jgi:hypothetical protein
MLKHSFDPGSPVSPARTSKGEWYSGDYVRPGNHLSRAARSCRSTLG